MLATLLLRNHRPRRQGKPLHSGRTPLDIAALRMALSVFDRAPLRARTPTAATVARLPAVRGLVFGAPRRFGAAPGTPIAPPAQNAPQGALAGLPQWAIDALNPPPMVHLAREGLDHHLAPLPLAVILLAMS